MHYIFAELTFYLMEKRTLRMHTSNIRVPFYTIVLSLLSHFSTNENKDKGQQFCNPINKNIRIPIINTRCDNRMFTPSTTKHCSERSIVTPCIWKTHSNLESNRVRDPKCKCHRAKQNYVICI